MRRFVAVVKAKSVEIQIIKFQNRNNMQKVQQGQYDKVSYICCGLGDIV